MKELPNNRARLINSTDSLIKELSEQAKIAEQVNSIPVEESEDNYDEETAISMEGELEINGNLFPPPTTAVLVLLDLIKSPFISTGNPSFQDVYNALFVLKFREKSFKDCYGIFSAKKYLDKYETLVEKSPEYLEVILKYREEYENKLQKFFALSAGFGDSLGIIKLDEVTQKLEKYLMNCFGGFNMIPKDGEHKKKDLTANG